MSNTTVKFASGTTRSLPSELAQRVVGLSPDGRVVVKDEWADYLFGLTLCCNAYDKGMENGVGCRACYGPDAGEYFFWGPPTGFDPVKE